MHRILLDFRVRFCEHLSVPEIPNYRTLKGAARTWGPGKPTPEDEYHRRFLIRFWAKVNKNGRVMRPGLGPCWEWTGSKQKRGYGQIGHRSAWVSDKRPMRAHVAAWTFVYGHPAPPKGWFICHECNNPSCVREDHLWPGTPADNVHHAQTTGLIPKVDWEAREQARLEPLNKEARRQREFIDRNLYLVPKREQKILTLRYGYDYHGCLTLEEVGQILKITRERVRQLQERAEEKIYVFTIEQNIPIPKPRGRDLNHDLTQTFEAMEPGDSFTVERESATTIRTWAATRGYMITTRTIGSGRSRVWLVSKKKAA